MNITLKAKHFRLIVWIIKDNPAAAIYRLLTEIKTKVLSSHNNEDEITIATTPAEIMYVYPLVSELCEGLAAEINKEMDEMFKAQIIAGIQNNDLDFISIAEKITTYKKEWSDRLSFIINTGKQFLDGT